LYIFHKTSLFAVYFYQNLCLIHSSVFICCQTPPDMIYPRNGMLPSPSPRSGMNTPPEQQLLISPIYFVSSHRVCLFKKSPSLQLALQALEPKSPASLLQTSALYVIPLRIRIAIYLAIKHRMQLNHITQQSLMLQFPDGR